MQREVGQVVAVSTLPWASEAAPQGQRAAPPAKAQAIPGVAKRQGGGVKACLADADVLQQPLQKPSPQPPQVPSLQPPQAPSPQPDATAGPAQGAPGKPPAINWGLPARRGAGPSLPGGSYAAASAPQQNGGGYANAQSPNRYGQVGHGVCFLMVVL